MTEQANFSELRNKISNWDVEAEQMLLDKMKIFTSSYKTDFALFTQNMQNFSNSLSNLEVQHYNAVSRLKDLSMNQFIEETLQENSESASEESDKGLEVGNISNENMIDINEKKKKVMEISMKNLEEINLKKNKNKEKIEDDTVSVTSKTLVLENSQKTGALPFIFGTEEFLNDKKIGLSNLEDGEEDENEQLNPEKELDLHFNEKDKKKWEKKNIKKQKQKQKEEQKLQKKQSKNNNEIENKNIENKGNNDDFDEEVKEQIQVPIENEKNNEIKEDNKGKKEDNNNNTVISVGKGSSVPPPPPPPPKPPVLPPLTKPKAAIPTKEIKQPVKDTNDNNNNTITNNNATTNNNTTTNNNAIEKNNNTAFTNNNTIMNNKTNQNTEPKPKLTQSMNLHLMKGLQNIVDDDDEDDDYIFGKKFRPKNPVLNDNIFKSQNPVVESTSDDNTNNNTKLNFTQTKLNNIFEDVKEDEEQEQKVKEEKKDMDNMGNNNMEQKNNIMENGVDNKIITKNQVFNSLFLEHEEEKNNSEIIEKKAPQNNLDNKKKFNFSFNDDDE